MLPNVVKWPLQFAGFVVCAWVMVQGAQFGYQLGGGGIEGAYWGGVAFLLTTLGVGLVLYAIRRGLERLAQWLLLRTVRELAHHGGDVSD